MSRVAKTAVNVPQGVDVTLKAESIAVKGALGVQVIRSQQRSIGQIASRKRQCHHGNRLKQPQEPQGSRVMGALVELPAQCNREDLP